MEIIIFDGVPPLGEQGVSQGSCEGAEGAGDLLSGEGSASSGEGVGFFISEE